MSSHLAAENLTFAYPNSTNIVEGFTIEVNGNERVALSAPSGRGKTTLCQLLAGYLEPASGSVTVDGRPANAQPGKPNPVQLIWQHPEQAMDPYLRIAQSLEEAGGAQAQLMEALAIDKKWLTRYPHELSGGELQRCCIARTLALQPKFIVADEISTMLDAITQAQIWKFLLSYCDHHDVGLVFVTHSDSLRERIATRTVYL